MSEGPTLKVGDVVASERQPEFKVSGVVSFGERSELDRLGERLREAVKACELAATRRRVLADALSSAEEAERAAWGRAQDARADVLEACGLPRPEKFGGTTGVRMQHAH